MSTPQLPHSYYFTTRILVLKFTKKGVFMGKIQDSHFPRKREYFMNVDKKGLILMSSILLWKWGFIWAEKSVFCWKKGLIFDWKVSVLSWKRGCFELKSQCFAAKKGVIFKLENKDVYHLFQWVREPGSMVGHS